MSDDLLARERELLGDTFGSSIDFTLGRDADDLDFDRAASAFPDIDLDGGDIPPPPPVLTHKSNSSGPFNFGSFAPPYPPPSAAIKITGDDDDIGQFESAFPVVQTVISPPSFSSTPAFAPRPQVISTPLLQTSVDDEEEPEVIRMWREEQAEAIALRDEEMERKKRETIANAQRSIDHFYEEYNAKKEQQIKENKEQEAAYLADLADSLSAGTTWSRICNLIGLENSQSKTIIAQTSNVTTDLSRYREILLQLKREGITAPGAAGY